MGRRRIILYVALAFGLAWGLWFAVVYPLFGQAGSFTVSVQLAVAAGMFAPALAAATTRLVTREGFADAWVVPTGFRAKWRTYALAWFGPLALTVAGAALYYLLNPSDFDPSMSYVIDAARQAAQASGSTVPVDDASLRMSLVGSLAMVLVAPAINAVTCFGEEWGWRGYLLPHLLEHLSMGQTLLVSGLVWGLWHAPITVLGHNYGVGYAGYPFTGIAAMCLFCTVLGVFMGYVTLRTGSCLPAVFAHGMVNGCAQLGITFSATGGNPFVGPMPTGIVGGAFFVVAALVMACDLVRNGWDAPARSEEAMK